MAETVVNGDINQNELETISESDDGQSPKSVTSLRRAIERLDVTEVETILRNGFDVQNNLLDQRRYRTALHCLVMTYISYDQNKRPPQSNVRFVDIMSSLLQYGVDINEKDISRQTALHMVAAKAGHSDIIKVLLSSGADVDIIDRTGQSALHKAATAGSVYGTKALLEAGANVHLLDSSGFTPLHLSCKKRNNSSVIDLLLQYGSDANKQDTEKNKLGLTPLQVACRHSNKDAVKLLLGAGVLVNVVDGSGQTCVHLAAIHDITGSIIPMLVEHKADINIQDNLFGETPLHKAVKHHVFENIRALIKARAQPNIQDHLLETPLHIAATSSQDLHVWTLLLKGGANCHIKNKQHVTPLDKALKSRNNLGLAIMRQYDTQASPKLSHRSVHY